MNLRLTAIAPAIIFGLLVMNAAADQDFVLHEGTPVRMKINRTVSSGTAHEGENVDFQTLDDIKVNATVVVPRGSTAMATVTEAVPKGRMGKGGKLNMNIDYVRMPNGDKLALRGVQDVKGGGHVGAMAAGMVATAIVFWPAAPLFLLIHGKDISIPEGHEVTVYTNSDYKPVAATSQTKVTEVVPTATASLHNLDVVKLKNAGFSEQMIVAKIKSSPGNYDLGTDDLLRLKAAGISEDILNVMMTPSSH
ncbi:MAG: hypothetical protein M3Y72_08910 [Acidobacteriota bacterium]|nr:hypothetical protein [Acidobacteriota bacterium]